MNNITLYVDNVATTIDGKFPKGVYEEFKKELGYIPENALWQARANPYFKGYFTCVCWNMDKCRCSIKKDGTHFPTGLISKAIGFFALHNIPCSVVDLRDINIAKSIREVPYTLTSTLNDGKPFSLFDYQKSTIDKAISSQRGIIKVATGGGKTVIASGIISELGVKPTIFYVTSIDLLNQAVSEITQYVRLNNLKVTVGSIGGGNKKIGDITVITIQSAMRALDAVYKTYDEEDIKEEETEIDDIKKDIVELIHSAKLIICDECITGDSTVITKDGRARMDELSEKIGKDVQSFDGNSVVWKKITHFYRKGKRKIIKIVLSDGKSIRCTMDHPIKTSKGWLPAAAIGLKDRILCTVNAVVKNEYLSSEKHQVDIQDMSLDTKLVAETKTNGFEFSPKQPMLAQSANVAAASESNYIMGQSTHSLQTKEAENTIPTSMDMINDLKSGINVYQQNTNSQFSERFSETLHCHSHQSGAKIQDSIAITDYANQSGQNTNQIDLHFLPQNTGSMRTADTEINQLRSELLATLNYRGSTKSPIKMERKESQNSGSIPSEMSDLHGGYATTDMEEIISSNYIQNLSLNRKLKSLQIGFVENMENVQYTSQEGIKLSIFAKRPEKQSLKQSVVTFQNVCDTNYVTVESVEECGEEEVYDITVEDTHCFFANEILVHNCQHWAAETCTTIADNSLGARWKYGLSATPWRDKGDDILIDACFGKTIVDINASFLIERGFLVKPNIAFININNTKGHKFGPYPSVYKNALVENNYRNNIIAGLASSLKEKNRNVLILIQQIVHGEILEDLIEGSIFLHGKSGKARRKDHIEELRLGKPSITIASTIFDEGIDVKPLNSLILAGGGKSSTRALQRVGRVIRNYTYPNGNKKEDAFVYDFHDVHKYLTDHSLARRKIYQSEPLFDIQDFSLP
jgi:superfamily II DNA or RNA helicase